MLPADSAYPSTRVTESHLPMPRKTPFLDMTDLYHQRGTADQAAAALMGQPEAKALFEAEIAYSRGDIHAVYEKAQYFLDHHSGFYAIIAEGMLLGLCAMWKGDFALFNKAKNERSYTNEARNMKLLRLGILLLALFLVGCSSHPPEMTTISPTLPSETTTHPEPETTQVPSEPEPPATETAPTETQPTEPQPTEPEPTEPIFQPEPADADFVMVTAYIPDIRVELRYATENNFTGQQIYPFTKAYLRYGTVKKLMPVQEELRQQGLSLKIWDGFRPPSAQFTLWEVYPDHTYVSNPHKGYSSHSRGNTVDLTLVYADGSPVEMPTEFDDFSKQADRDYRDCTDEAAAHSRLLETLMEQHGFKPYSKEWWHFTDTDTYEVEEEFEPVTETRYYADCQEYINLRTAPDRTTEVITTIPKDETFLMMAKYDNFAYVAYQGLYGYVLMDYIQPISSP